MKLSQIFWLVPLLTIASAQKTGSKSPKQTRQAPSQSFGHSNNNNLHDDGIYPSQPQQHAQPRQHHQQQPYKAYAPAAGIQNNPVYAQIIQDDRQLNHDGTINFQYAADNGLQQGETVDADGTRRGFYSYPGADGKPITVKYTAGKNGFQAEGDHLPRQPQVPAHSDSDEDYREINKSGGGGGNSGAYVGGGGGGRPAAYRSPPPQPRPQPHYAPQPAPQSYPRHASPAPYVPQAHGHYKQGNSQNAVQYSTGRSPPAFQDVGPVNYGAPSHAAPQVQYSHPQPSRSPSYGGSRGGGQMFTANNPYQQAGPAGPYNAGFDLGNGGQFAIDFNPGQSQQVNVGGDFSVTPSQQRY